MGPAPFRRESSFGDGLGGVQSTGTLAVSPGNIYLFTLTGVVSGSSLVVSATVTDTTTSSSISLGATDSANLLTGSFFGYLDRVQAQDGGTTAIDVDFDDFTAAVPEPSAVLLLVVSSILFSSRRVRA